MSGCRGCGATLPPKTHQGRDRIWCSDRCRKQTLYGGTCIDCGAPTNGSDGRGANASKRCNRCSSARNRGLANAQRERDAAPRRQHIAEMYNAGVPFKDMAADLGVTVGCLAGHINHMRNQGWDLPRRYPLKRAEAMSTGRLAANRERVQT